MTAPPITSATVRDSLVDALRLDLVGPCPGQHPADARYAEEHLPMAPSKWYLTGFLVPRAAPEGQREGDSDQEELDLAGDADTEGDEDTPPEKVPVRRLFFPSSIGLSVLIPAETVTLEATVTWGDYSPDSDSAEADESSSGVARDRPWRRAAQSASCTLAVPAPRARAKSANVPGSDGLKLVISVRPADGVATLPEGTCAAAVFLVNEREPSDEQEKDRGFAFQATLQLSCAAGFVARPDPRHHSQDWDDRVADLQYRDAVEYATGHGVSAQWSTQADSCTTVSTTWMPRAHVPFVRPRELGMEGVMLGMEALAAASPPALQAGLTAIVDRYGEWIASQHLPADVSAKQRGTGNDLLEEAKGARRRMAEGIALLSDPTCLRAFQLANRAMAMTARRRMARQAGTRPVEARAPAWRPFQLAFLLLNLRGIAEPAHADREVVDLLFFPTGGGKTEAYLGIAAFTILLRRLRHEGVRGAGVSVIMRYTLRLLTLDQLGRASGLVCAMEILRRAEHDLGPWPFEIGLWVGRAATPNRMGAKGDQDETTARMRVTRYQRSSGKSSSPIPIEECPWCGTRFTKDAFQLKPNADRPIDLRIGCVNPACDFTGDSPLPIVAVDEPLYRRLPCFIIATVDKFAALPFEGRSAGLFGMVDRCAVDGFYGAADPGLGDPLPGGALPPPDLVIQDELHLISGPLGTIAGLYETAIDWLATRKVDGALIRPKVIASTATVRRADRQIRALFAREATRLFPPAGITRTDSFFAQTASESEELPRAYLGIAAPGRSLKVVMLRTYVALLAASLRAWKDSGGDKGAHNPADPYLTLLGYFNALRELGGARRIIEDEVGSQVRSRSLRRRVDETTGLFHDREIEYEVLELTSRVSTADVAAAKGRLEVPWRAETKGKRVDVAIATNMISVGLDITRLGLMVVAGQPKGSAEYIQATSRVGRDPSRPGLVVTLLTLNKPRDRSHYERFGFYHQTFYRSVEATSVTPFSPRALDRVLPALVVALARLGVPSLTPASNAISIEEARDRLGYITEALSKRVMDHDTGGDSGASSELRQKVQELAKELLDEWSVIAHEQGATGAGLRYQQYEKLPNSQPLLRDPLDPALVTVDDRRRRFKAARSMRDVEPEVLLLLRK